MTAFVRAGATAGTTCGERDDKRERPIHGRTCGKAQPTEEPKCAVASRRTSTSSIDTLVEKYQIRTRAVDPDPDLTPHYNGAPGQ